MKALLQILIFTLLFSRPFICSLAFPATEYLWSMLFLSWLLCWVASRGITAEKIRPFYPMLVFFFLAEAISLFFSSDKSYSAAQSYKYLAGPLLFIYLLSTGENSRKKVLYTLITSAVIISLLAIYQYLFGFRHLLDYMAKEGIRNQFALDFIQRKRAYLPFVTPNILAGYLAMIMPLTFIREKTRWLVIPMAIAFLLAKSLGALASLIIALLIYFWASGRIRKKSIVLLAGLLITGAIILILRLETTKSHLRPEFSVAMRLEYWKQTLQIIKTHPIVGVGLGNFNIPQVRYTHNSYLQLWAEAGILGLISFLWLAWSALRRVKSPVIICASAVFLLHNLVDFSLFLPEVAILWWVIVGL